MAHLDHRAADESGDRGADLAAGDGNHHLVELADPFVVAAAEHQRLATPEPPQRDEVRLREPVTDGESLTEEAESAVGVVGEELTERGGDDQEAAFHAVDLVVVVEDPPGAARHRVRTPRPASVPGG
jgi:hypothetical protein